VQACFAPLAESSCSRTAAAAPRVHPPRHQRAHGCVGSQPLPLSLSQLAAMAGASEAAKQALDKALALLTTIEAHSVATVISSVQALVAKDALWE